ncbi:hypothetical protein WR25_10822 isoform F [Diploscapter pachys]|uniref:Sodium/hydrogen exchanger n=2 Tax=Diploscapter pachys TaxID=2018661 RepID=A0A2A2JAR1_9BILA|nr:hypothetical protein WR25_10822 isoform F [Diploscapter pachys]
MNYKWQNAMVLLLALALLLTQTAAKFSDKLEEAAQRRSANIHQLDTVILLSYILVLIVIVVTSWFFKHYHSRYLHESALSLIFGLIIGFVISYFKLGLLQSQTYDVTMKNLTIISEPPDYVRLEVKPEGSTSKVSFHYELIEGFYADTKSQNEQKIEQKAAFSPEVFFNLILPPIIFNAGYSLKKRHFFRNIGSILAFVFIGTTVSALATGFLMLILTKTFGMGFSMQELFFFGSLISATDPVTVISIFTELRVEADLFALVFGESALNDAVAIVLSNIIDGSSEFLASSPSVYAIVISTVKQFLYVFICSLLLGCSIGCLNALLTKMTSIHEHPLLECSLFVLLSYVSFLLSEVLGFTGIVSVLFCGITQAHYTMNNLSQESKMTTKQFFHMISFVLESFIFCYIGVSIFVANNQKWNYFFLLFSLISIVAARALFIYPLCSLLNIRRQPPIPPRYQHMLLFAGLRGAMAFALAARNTSSENRQVIYATTAAIVLITVIMNGGLTCTVIDILGIKHGSGLVTERDGVDPSPTGPIPTPSLAPSGGNPFDKSFLPRKWYNFDAK